MRAVYLVLYSVDKTENRAFTPYIRVDAEEAKNKYESFRDNMSQGGGVTACSYHKMHVNDDGTIVNTEWIAGKSLPPMKLTRYNQKKG